MGNALFCQSLRMGWSILFCLPKQNPRSQYRSWGMRFRRSNTTINGCPSLEYSQSRVSTLRKWTFSKNRLSGKIPDFNIINILDLSYNSFSGPIQLSVSNGTAITTLLLQGNQFTGFWPNSRLNWVNLERLDLRSLKYPFKLKWKSVDQNSTRNVQICLDQNAEHGAKSTERNYTNSIDDALKGSALDYRAIWEF